MTIVLSDHSFCWLEKRVPFSKNVVFQFGSKRRLETIAFLFTMALPMCVCVRDKTIKLLALVLQWHYQCVCPGQNH